MTTGDMGIQTQRCYLDFYDKTQHPGARNGFQRRGCYCLRLEIRLLEWHLHMIFCSRLDSESLLQVLRSSRCPLEIFFQALCCIYLCWYRPSQGYCGGHLQAKHIGSMEDLWYLRSGLLLSDFHT